MSIDPADKNPGKPKRPTTLVYADPTTFTMGEINKSREAPDRPAESYWLFDTPDDPE